MKVTWRSVKPALPWRITALLALLHDPAWDGMGLNGVGCVHDPI